MQFVPFEPDIEVNGQTVYAIVDGFSHFRRVASAILQQEGIGRMRSDGDLALEREGWYPQAAWLRAFERIAEEAGQGVLFAIGRRIPENARFPPGIVDLRSAIAAIDVAYHLNHRRRGIVMFDAAEGRMSEGIGHYALDRAREPGLVVTCTTPYPCEFDRGIVASMARRFEPLATIEHVPGSCRKHGHHACSYEVRS